MAQIKKKFLAPNAIDGSKLQFSNNEAFRAKSSSGQDVEVFKLDSSNVFQFLAMPRVGSDPSNGNEVTRKSYVDAQVLAEAAARVQADAAESAAREAAMAAEVSAREAADDALNAAIDQEVSDRQAAVSAEQSAREAAVSAESSARSSADATLQSNIDGEESRAMAAESALQDAIDAEQARAEGVEAGLQAAVDALNASSATALQDEIAARQAGDADLEGKINTEKGRIDAILLASDADKDSFAEIVQLINSVDTTNDNAFASYVLSNNAALAQEVSDRQSAVSAEQAAREAADSAESSARSSADTALGVRIDGVQSDLSDEASARASADTTLQGNIDSEEAARIAAVSSEESAREAADAALQSGLDQEVSDRQAAVSAEQARAEGAESDLQDSIDGEAAARSAAVSGEEAARMAADSGIQSELDSTQTGAGLGVDGSYTAPVGSAHLGSASSLKDADSKLDAAIVAESNARQTAVSNLEQGLSDLDAAMTQGFDDAQAYTDSKVAALIDGAPGLLDTLNELAAAIGDDENFASNILTAVGNEATARANADTAEASARSAADSALQDAIDAEESARIDAVSAEQSAREAADAAESAARTAELPRHAKVRYTMTSTDVSNGYMDLDHVVLGSSTHVFIDRLACHESDDYTLSTVNGKTRVTFSSGFMSSEEGPGEGDLFRCGYMYKNGDQA